MNAQVSQSGRTVGQLSRRDFLITSAVVGGGLALSVVAPRSFAAPGASGGDAVELGAWLTIAPDDTILLRVPCPETGNGAMTFAALLITEELRGDWNKTRVECISLNRDARERLVYGAIDGSKVFSFGGRSTEPKLVALLQEIGATAREQLRVAAARRWRVPLEQVEARNSTLIHAPSQRTLRYGEVAADAAQVKLARAPKIERPHALSLLAERHVSKVVDAAIVNGTAQYGIDATAPGMIYGAVMQSPVHGGRLKRHDFEAIRSMPGVIGIAVIEPTTPKDRLKTPLAGDESLLQSAVVVVAEHYWQARKALEALPLEWDDGDGAKWRSTEQVRAAVRNELEREGEKIAKESGDALKALAGASKVVEATYETPYADQAPLEPLNAMALYTPERLEVWHSGSISAQSFIVAAEEAGLPFEKVHLHQCVVGGNFGRRNFGDDLRIVVATAKQFPGRPIKVIWSREEMMRQGRYRWLTAGKLRAALGDDGLPSALHARVCQTGYGIAGLDNVAYVNGLIPNVRIETREMPIHILWGSYRAPGYNSYAFFMESFIDECAEAAGMDPLEYRLKLLAKHSDPGWIKCLEEVAARAGWGKPLPRGQGQGIAISNWGNWVSQEPQAGTTVAVIAHVEVSRRGELRVLTLDLAFDCGRVLNRDAVLAQMQGGALFGMNMALNEELNIENGRIVEGNFDRYPMIKLADVPQINVHFGALTGHDRLSEVGEPPVGPVGPAIANAIYRATGKRIRSMPFRKHDLSWS
jgi:isoquinoline 1-oxidoreductase beta subunit